MLRRGKRCWSAGVETRKEVLRQVLRRTLNFFAACGAKNVCGEHHFCEIEALNKAVGSHAATLANHANQRPPFSSRFEHFRQISTSFHRILRPNMRHINPAPVQRGDGCLTTWPKLVLVSDTGDCPLFVGVVQIWVTH